MKHLFYFTAAWALATTTVAQVSNLDDLEFNVGNGTNTVGVVVDFQDGNALAWGYRFDGTATAEDAIFSVVQADPRLVGIASTPGSFGVSIYGFGYDLDGDGIAYNPAIDTVPGVLTTIGGLTTAESSIEPALSGLAASDPDDVVRAAFSFDPVLFWSFAVAENGSPYDGGSWESAPTGISTYGLADQNWIGFTLAEDFSTVPGAAIAAAVPEPSVYAALLGFLAVLVATRRRFS